MKRLVLFVLVTGAAACGGDAKKDSPTTLTAQSSAVLNLQPASLTATVDGKPMEMALDAAGKVTVNGEVVATLTPAGEARDTNDRVVATIAGDGRVTIVGEPSEEMVVKEDGTIVSKGEQIVAIGTDSVLTGKLISEADAKIAYGGAPQARRAMMLAWLISMSAPQPSAAPPAAAGTTP